MNKTPLLSLLALPLCVATSYSQVLVAGWNGTNDSNAPQVSPTVDVTATLTSTQGDTLGHFMTAVNASSPWGTTTLDVAPADPQTYAGSYNRSINSPYNTNFSWTLQVTNHAASDLQLNQIHWISGRDTNDAATDIILTYTAGDLTDATGATTTVDITAAGTQGYDVSLSGFLSDTTLATGESATFTWVQSGRNESGNPSIRVDNFALSGSVVDTGPDTTKPSPDPMSWASVPAATGDSSITMTATTATDDSGVEYFFDETSGNPGGTDSGWQNSSTYTDTGLDPATEYTYTVTARDKSANQNATAASSPASATTNAPDTTKPSPNPMTWASVPTAVNDSSITMTATTATDNSGVEYFFDEISGNPGGTDSGWQDSATYTDSGLDPETEYTYTVTARDKAEIPNVTDPSAAASATTDPTPVGPVLLGGFDGTNAVNAPIQHSSAVGNVGMVLSSSTLTGGFNPGNFLTGGTLWGTTDLDPDAAGGLNNLAVSDTPLDMTFTVTNTSADKDVSLDTLHWVSKRDVSDAPTHATITYVSGSLTDALGTNGDVFLGSTGIIGYDYELSTLMSDRTLAPGETAVFSFTTYGANTEGNDRLRMDNFALSGTFSDSDYIAWSNAQSWTVGAPNTSGNDDYDLDGMSNDAERIFGLDPTDSASQSPIVTPLNPSAGTFSYTRRTNSMTGLNYPVWYSTDLVEWFRDINASETPGTPANDIEIVDVTINPVLLTEPKLFLRLGPEPPVTLPAPALSTIWGSQSTVTLVFSEELYQLTAANAGNYTVELDGGSTINVTGAALSEDKKVVTLTLASNLDFASAYNVNFSNLTGVTGVTIAGGNSGQFETWDDDPTGIKVFILAGQSNMVGYGKTEQGRNPAYTPTNGEPEFIAGGLGSLRYIATEDAADNNAFPEYDYASLLADPSQPTTSAWASRSDVKVWWYNGASGNLPTEIDTPSKGDLGPPFHGAGSSWIGPEYAFGQIVGDYYASDDVLIIKTCWGGHSLAGDFRPPSAVAARGGEVGASYLEMITRVREVLSNLGTEFPEWSGRGYEIVGFGWHQGTNDKNALFEGEYKHNLPDLISDVRSEFGKPTLPFVIATTGMQDVGPVEPFPYSGYDEVEKAQLWVAGVEQPVNVLTDDTRGYWREASISPSGVSFHWNHNAESYFLVGKGLGDMMVTLLTPTP